MDAHILPYSLLYFLRPNLFNAPLYLGNRVVKWWRCRCPGDWVRASKLNLQQALNTRIPNAVLNFAFKLRFKQVSLSFFLSSHPYFSVVLSWWNSMFYKLSCISRSFRLFFFLQLTGQWYLHLSSQFVVSGTGNLLLGRIWIMSLASVYRMNTNDDQQVRVVLSYVTDLNRC